MSSVKVKRALGKAVIGDCRGSAGAMLAHIPDSIIAQVNSSALAELVDAMWRACQQSKSLAAAEIIADGTVWDARAGRLREIAA